MSGKHHATGAQGGIVFTRDEDLHWKSVRFGDRGKPHNLDVKSNVVASLNFNQNDLAAAIGRVQLRKLPSIAERRHKAGEAIRAALADSALAVKVGPLVPETESSYWFMRMTLDLKKLRVDKAKFVEALVAEGIPASPSYRNIPSEAKWFVEQRVFGSSGYPWQCPDYKGPRHPQYDLPNIDATIECTFNMSVHENYGEAEVRDIVAALRKVEEAYLA